MSEIVRETLFQLVTDEFPGAMPGFTMTFEGQKKDPPKGAPFIYVTLQEGKSWRANIGNVSQFKAYGVLNVQILQPEDTGTKAARLAADALFRILADRQMASADGLGSVTLCEVETRNRGTLNGFQVFNVMATYWHRFSIDRTL